jgi:hypothetical protein
MKKLIPFSLVVCMAICAIDGFAQVIASNFTAEPANHSKKDNTSSSGNLAAVVTQSYENKFNIVVHVENHDEGKFTVKLKSPTSLLHKESVKNKTYVRKYDMFNLPVGEYIVEVENGKEVFTKKISISKNNGARVLTIL